MVQRTIIELIDDLDGSPATETVQFSLDGVNYEIDLSLPNADQFRLAMGIFMDKGRRTGGRKQRVAAGKTPSGASPGSLAAVQATYTTIPAVSGPTYSKADRRAMQKFAREHGLRVPGLKGRIAADIAKAWEEAGRPRGPHSYS